MSIWHGILLANLPSHVSDKSSNSVTRDSFRSGYSICVYCSNVFYAEKLGVCNANVWTDVLIPEMYQQPYIQRIFYDMEFYYIYITRCNKFRPKYSI
jgi:hypothetical protein